MWSETAMHLGSFHSAERYRPCTAKGFLEHQIQAHAFEIFVSSITESVRTPCTNQTVPYGTAVFGWRCSRHFVPGYDRTVPPGLIATVSN